MQAALRIGARSENLVAIVIKHPLDRAIALGLMRTLVKSPSMLCCAGLGFFSLCFPELEIVDHFRDLGAERTAELDWLWA